MFLTIGIGAITDLLVSICLMFSVGQDLDEFFSSGYAKPIASSASRGDVGS